MSERRLVTIRKINDIRPIEGADAIEVATVDGWDVVVSKKENHKVGNLVVYFEIDSFLPRWEEFKFLEKNCLRKMGDAEGLRLRTIKLRGQVSQGLIMPLERKLNAWLLNVESKDIRRVVEEDQDVTELLEVIKWDPPLPASLGGVAKGNFPSFIRKTDQERVQNNFRKVFDAHRDHNWEVSLKLDGSSFTAYYNEGKFGVCSRNLDLAESEENSFWQAARKYSIETTLKLIKETAGFNVAVQGELMGPGIQGNREGFKELKMFVFNFFNIDKQEYVDPITANLLTKNLGLDYVPILLTGTLDFKDVAEVLQYAEGPSITHPIREGLVFKSINDPSLSFKAISNSYLLKSEH